MKLRRGGRGLRGALGVAAALVATLLAAPSANALPPGFEESTVFNGLTTPTVVRFAPDGRVLVAEQRGVIKSFSGPGDTTPDVVADLRTRVHGYWERGLLGMALDPNFVANGRIYVAYTHDAPIGGTAPTWGQPNSDAEEPCPGWIFPTTPGPGCPVSGRISRLTLNGTAAPQETVLLEDWCQQYPSHTVGHLEFRGGALYASAGEGADFFGPDWGQVGSPTCGDPLNEGGALRSQDLRTDGDPVTLDGTVIRINPANGNPWPGNPGTGSANQQRIIAYGLRNPFRFAISPGGELWIGDVGWDAYEELNSISAAPSSVANFGWPCYEGPQRQPTYDSADRPICESLYAAPGAVTAPRLAYLHGSTVAPGDTCPTGSSALAGLDFYTGNAFPSSYSGALFVADYVRDCIWVIPAGAGGSPNPAAVRNFAPGAANPSFLEVGPDGALYYTDLDGGRVQRIGVNQAPTARLTANPTSGPLPLVISFDASASSDPDFGDTLDYAWDLDGDGVFDDSSEVALQRTYIAESMFDVQVRVTDDDGVTDTASVAIAPGGAGPRTERKLKVRILKLRIPESRKRLLARGGRAKLRCNRNCFATLRLVAKGRAAKRIGIRGEIAKEGERLRAGKPEWVTATLTRRAERRLRRADVGLKPRITAKVRARPR